MLAVLRAFEGMTQADLAKRAGVDRNTIARIEARRHRPRTLTMVRIAAALGYDVRRVFPEFNDKAGA